MNTGSYLVAASGNSVFVNPFVALTSVQYWAEQRRDLDCRGFCESPIMMKETVGIGEGPYPIREIVERLMDWYHNQPEGSLVKRMFPEKGMVRDYRELQAAQAQGRLFW